MKSSIKKISQFLSEKATQCCRVVAYRCDLCLQPCETFTLLCDTCHQDLVKFNFNSCQGDLLNHPKVSNLLGNVKFHKLLSLAPYQWPYSHWITQLKYQHRFELGGLLGQVFAQHLTFIDYPVDIPNVIIPVPLHGQRLKARQYNQAALIGKALAKCIGKQCAEKLIYRIQNTDPQVGQSGVSRRKSLAGAFALREGAKLPDHVCLLDDVLTTGSTVNEISQLLLQHGVKRITVLTICLVIKP